MRARIGGLALAGVAAMAMSPAAVPSAAATATTWTVRPSGAITATAGKTTLKDTTTDLIENCKSSRMSGTLKGGSGLHGTGIGSISTAAYNCPSPIVPPFRLTARGLPWHLNLVSYDAGTGVSRGTISHLELALTGPGCSAVVNGTSGATADGVVAVSYAGKTGKLTIHAAGGNLHWYHVSGCAGLVGDGHPATLSAAHALSPRQMITSP
jgi:hypothetical protein